MGYHSLNKDENEVYSLAREYLKKKSLFSIIEIIDYVHKRTKYNENINKNKIEIIIKSLIKKKLILPRTKLVKQNLLKNPVRYKIYQTIRENSGININDLMRKIGIGSNQVIWHLSFLVKFDCIRMKKFGNQKAYFLQGSDPKLDKLKFYMRNDKVKKIINTLKRKSDGMNPTSLKKFLGMNYNTIKKYLDILDELHVVKVINSGYEKVYSFNRSYNIQLSTF